MDLGAGGHAGKAGTELEGLLALFGLRLLLGAPLVDDRSADAVHDRPADRGVEREGDRRKMRLERCGDGNREIARHIAWLADREIDQDILDHGTASLGSPEGGCETMTGTAERR